MCLSNVRKVTPSRQTGIGYKVVRVNPDGTFSPRYPYMSPRFGGINSTQHEDRAIKIRIVYKLGVKTYTKSKTIVQPDSCVKYEAGIHLFKHQIEARCHYHVSRKYILALIKCQYYKAYAQDDMQIVAKAIKPLEVIYEQNQVHY